MKISIYLEESPKKLSPFLFKGNYGNPILFPKTLESISTNTIFGDIFSPNTRRNTWKGPGMLPYSHLPPNLRIKQAKHFSNHLPMVDLLQFSPHQGKLQGSPKLKSRSPTVSPTPREAIGVSKFETN